MTTDTKYREPEESDDDSVSSPCDDEPSEECEDDRCGGPELPIWHCVDCDSSYCRWVNSRKHCVAALDIRMLTKLSATVGAGKDLTNRKRKDVMASRTRRLVRMLSEG